MACPPGPVLQDSAGGLWTCSCDDNGILNTSVILGVVPGLAPVLPDPLGNNWLLGVDTVGELTISPSSSPASSPVYLLSPSRFFFQISVTSVAFLETSFVKNSALPAVGNFYKANYNGIAWQLTAGRGSNVTPTQNNGAFTNYPVPGQIFSESGQALWHASCGHGFDVFRFFRDYDDYCKQSVMVVTCPMCSIVIGYIEPYEAGFDPVSHPIIVAAGP